MTKRIYSNNEGYPPLSFFIEIIQNAFKIERTFNLSI